MVLDKEVSIKSMSSTGVHYKKPLIRRRTLADIEEFKKDLALDDHFIPLDDLCQRYKTNLKNGITQEQADIALKANGPNVLCDSASKSKIKIFLELMFGGFAGLLWAGALLCFVSFAITYYRVYMLDYDQIMLGSVLVIVNLFTGIFGFIQETANKAIMDSFKKMVPHFATVIRNGLMRTIPSEEIVVGDLVLLKSGGTAPADVRVIEASSLKVDNSPITGESVALSKTEECTDANPLETSNLVFFSTNIVEGSGKGIVVATGDQTLIGHIAGLTSAIQKEETPIHKEIKRFVKIISYIAIAIGVCLFIVCVLTGYAFFTSFTYFIAIVVANVPEALPVTMTACMTLTAKQMASKNCMVKKLEAIETLGSCNVICSDKTGTLTQNRMTVVHLYYDFQEYDVLTEYDRLNKTSLAYQAMCDVGRLCSRAVFDESERHITTPINQLPVIGDASEAAILKFFESAHGDTMEKREANPKVAEIPFNSNNKFQVSVHWSQKNQHLLVLKGAPERVIDRCTIILVNDEESPMTEEVSKTFKQAILALGHKGERVLAFAQLILDEDKFPKDFAFNSDKPNFPLTELCFVGLISMMDPPRPAVPDAVRRCRRAGIRVIMVTGDHPVTAVAIARKVGIISPENETFFDIAMRTGLPIPEGRFPSMECGAGVITGNDLREMTEYEVIHVLGRFNEIVFARTSPQQKLKIVEALQNIGCVVAVTGDGVNDSPALKKANIGIAMGIAGSEVAKNAADMILLDDNFSSIVTGIEEGRLIFDNLKKSIAYVLTSNTPELLPFIAMILLKIPEPLTVMAIIVIDVGTDLWPAISLAYERPEADIMNQRPRDPTKDRLVNAKLLLLTYIQIGFLQALAAFMGWAYVMYEHGFLIQDLIGIRPDWETKSVHDLRDSWGQEWTYEERQYVKHAAVSGYFLSIVVTQVADVLICKTRRLSMFQQGLHNWVLNGSIMFEICFSLFVVYTPYLNTMLQFAPISGVSIMLAVPFALVMFGVDEYRKYMIRCNPNGLFFQETYY